MIYIYVYQIVVIIENNFRMRDEVEKKILETKYKINQVAIGTQS